MSSLLEVTDLTVTMPNGTVAVDRVTFTVAEGEIVGFIGESGSGKSTTANAVARLLPVGSTTEGSIRFDGRDIAELSRRELGRYRDVDIGMVFQDPRSSVNPVATVGEYVTEALRVNRGMSRRAATRRAVELFTEVGIPDPEHRLTEYPHQFSGGMLQRAVIAAALSTDPRLMLADEATTALDVIRQAEVVAIMRRACRRRHLGLVFITHDLELAGALCDRVCVMYEGRIVEQVDAADLHSRAHHPYTLALLRSRPTLRDRPHRLPTITAEDRTAFVEGSSDV